MYSVGKHAHRRISCALCSSSNITEVLSLAPTPPANAFAKTERDAYQQDRYPLDLMLCGHCGHVQLGTVVDPSVLFKDYVYVSGTSPSFVRHFEEYATSVISEFRLSSDDLIVEIGSNDGTLLKAFRSLGIPRVLGIDPAVKICERAREEGIDTITGFFGRSLALELRKTRGPANVILANNVFAHAEDLREIALGVRDLIHRDGLFIFEVSYLKDVVDKCLFDTIYHEHLSYHAVKPLVEFLESVELSLLDVKRVSTHGGSLRCYATPVRSQPSHQVTRLIATEFLEGLHRPETYHVLQERIEEAGKKLRDLIPQCMKMSKGPLIGYGAPAKLTTLFHALKLDAPPAFDFICDDSPWKQGLFAPGSGIPIVPPSRLAETPEGTCIVFAWNFWDAIVKKNHGWKGTFIEPISGRTSVFPHTGKDL